MKAKTTGSHIYSIRMDVPSSLFYSFFMALINHVNRFFCVPFTGSDTHVRMLEDCIQETILEQNKLAACSDRSVLGIAKHACV